MIHARADYNRIQDPAVDNPALLAAGTSAIAADEPVFLLRARDITSAATVRAWAHLNRQLGGSTDAINSALYQAERMEQWAGRKLADIPKI